MTLADATGDELAGVVDLFGAVTRTELEDALAELAFKRGETVDDEAITAAVDDAVAGYYLVSVDGDGTTLLAPGPAAFPALPDGAEDLPHILDVPDRQPERAELVEAAERRLRADAARAVDADDDDRIERLRDVSYDLETWGSTDVSGVRRHLDDALENRN
ncbi:hypothetical protein DU504_02750 [Haloplanus salinus]|jgi:hypothetical protein|uniref:Uncharacterized protein n=1 Tax=Haloplanus salinus TaxID=1126245 RepID=A0A368NAL0_9EURY|nr:hypothetical protein [Haloplanus salinus]RCU46319.1 hypothetical protein DU504_02750 [Haloplanus salinus]